MQQLTKLVDRRPDAVVHRAHRLRARDARKVEVALLLHLEAAAARDDGRRGLSGHIVAEGRVARLARDADHARQHGGPFVEVRLLLDLVVRLVVRLVLLQRAELLVELRLIGRARRGGHLRLLVRDQLRHVRQAHQVGVGDVRGQRGELVRVREAVDHDLADARDRLVALDRRVAQRRVDRTLNALELARGHRFGAGGCGEGGWCSRLSE